MGHQRFAGLVTEETLSGAAFLRIDIPATGKQVAFTKLFSPSSVYSITPTTEELATAMAASINNTPIAIYDLPEAMQAKLRAPMNALPAPSQVFDEMDDAYGDHDYDNADEPY